MVILQKREKTKLYFITFKLSFSYSLNFFCGNRSVNFHQNGCFGIRCLASRAVVRKLPWLPPDPVPSLPVEYLHGILCFSLSSSVDSLYHIVYVVAPLNNFFNVFCLFAPKGKLGMSDVSILSGISGLSFDSPFLSPLLFSFSFLPSPLALSVLSFFSMS